VPTISFYPIMVGTAQVRLCPPYVSIPATNSRRLIRSPHRRGRAV